ncbi:MAG: glycosyltransferase family 4 protein [Candidatus Heimdallarchaeota archaeon]
MSPKILILSYEYSPIGGGGGVFTKRLATGLARLEDFHVDVVTGYHPSLPRHESQKNLRIWRVGIPRKNLAHVQFREMLSYSLSAVLWALKHNRTYDLVNSHFAVPSSIGALPYRFLRRKPHVLTLLGSDVYNPFEYKRPLEIIRPFLHFLYNSADLLVAPSEDLRQRCYQKKPRNPILVIPHGIDLEPYTSETQATKIGSIVCVSRLIPRKAHQYLVSALPHIIQTVPEATLCFIGDGPETKHLQKLAKKLGVQSKVQFTGHLSQKEAIRKLATADIFALHTLHEAFGLVYLEAMALGKPIVTTTEGAGREVIGEAGLFVPPRDAKALAQAITELIVNRELRDKKGEAGLKRVNNYCWDAIIQRYAQIFKNC